ncbi:MAG: malto-oligosyltrehalose trehalohydrolase, partial [Frankiales bacterium]|nr:malto-oligosyltrehalose trehalohydrolase [Frankiales bacterium]
MTLLRVWAPLPRSVELDSGGRRTPMDRQDGGWWTGEVGGPDTDYSFVLDGGDPRPDPRSAWQPQGVHGPSRVVDHDAFAWTDATWRGVPLAGSVLYELHV